MADIDEVNGRKIDQEGNIFLFPQVGKGILILFCMAFLFVASLWAYDNREELFQNWSKGSFIMPYYCLAMAILCAYIFYKEFILLVRSLFGKPMVAVLSDRVALFNTFKFRYNIYMFSDIKYFVLRSQGAAESIYAEMIIYDEVNPPRCPTIITNGMGTELSELQDLMNERLCAYRIKKGLPLFDIETEAEENVEETQEGI